ncbi:TetR/AcrR family transcriptional regulator [Comamonas flocculans]|uniref:TetR/AcrR family transcriptional regulator n=1 Tax=Comamonas flocculans TaxID=2597701 RepID=A0A5B8S0X9_9BURK|nr:TetR/AcrR family transcriptional regulator [Comamonas flocculans]QEA14097.1 TetR/AcrR family transcriptional regulator [Comamonas flocculans]
MPLTGKKTSPRPPSTHELRAERRRRLADVRQELVLDAARSAFFELGMEKTSIREIARRAGYTPGALYSYFPSKEHIYGALLGESLERLNTQVQLALQAAESPAERLRAGASAFFDFYRVNPHDLDLGFYLFQGMAPRGLTPELDARLNTRLRDALLPCHAALQALGLDNARATAEVTALFAHIVGLLVMSHTGRIRMFGQSSQALFVAYLDSLSERAQRP